MMDENTLAGRLEKLIELLRRECQVMQIEKEISDKVNESMDKNQRDYYLHEQLNIISSELGEGDDTHGGSGGLPPPHPGAAPGGGERDQAPERGGPPRQDAGQQPGGHRHPHLPGHLPGPALETPLPRDDLDINKAQEILDHDHYGLKKVKDRILEMLAVRKLAPRRQGPDHLPGGPSGRGQDQHRPVDRTVPEPEVRPAQPGRRAG